ncbi:MAG: hypothetical protein ACOC2L_00045 [Candidatus Sumerlaeota bacterium]
MNDQLKRCLDDLENRIDPAQEKRLREEWIAFLENGAETPVFDPRRDGKNPPRVEWPDVRINAAIEDYDLMALSEFKAVSGILAEGQGAMLGVRSNYGTGILPLLFGTELFVMPEETNTLPTAVPLHDEDKIRALIEAGVPGLEKGYGAQVFEMGRRYMSIMEEYPKIREWVSIYHPDIQGPLDVCEVVWGSDVFMALYTSPDLVKQFLELITETYIAFLDKWRQIVAPDGDYSVHWRVLHKGRIMLRDDSAMNVSGDLFGEFVEPFDGRLLKHYGGGAIHFCGRGDHYIDRMTRMEGLHAIQMSQPHLNDMETIYQATVDRSIPLLDFNRDAAEKARAEGRDLKGYVQV